MQDGTSDTRGKKSAKDGFFTQARSIGHRVKRSTDSKFDDDGDELEDKRDLWLQWDRYFETLPGTDQARHALDRVIENRNKRGMN